jgi:hypothetical protein
MKQVLYILGLIVLIVIAAKIFVWAMKTVLILAVIAVVLFFGIKLLTGKKPTG